MSYSSIKLQNEFVNSLIISRFFSITVVSNAGKTKTNIEPTNSPIATSEGSTMLKKNGKLINFVFDGMNSSFLIIMNTKNAAFSSGYWGNNCIRRGSLMIFYDKKAINMGVSCT